METGNPALWLALCLFILTFAGLFLKAYLPAHRVDSDRSAAQPSRPAWLLCEIGTSTDRGAGPIPLVADLPVALGHEPRKDTPAERTYYLHAEDLEPVQVRLSYQPATGRYEVEVLAGSGVRHNGTEAAGGTRFGLREGDLLQLGEVTTLRFTFVDPQSGAA